MKQALFLVYDYPPCRAPGAAVRTAKFVRHLPASGWRATVLCRDEGLPDDLDHETPILRIPELVGPRLSYQLAAWLWATRVVGRARALLRERHFDVVYASCPPFPHALSAVLVSQAAGLPLVVDFRDAWSLDPHESGGMVKRLAKRALRRSLYTTLERWLLRRVDALIVNTPTAYREYARLLAHATDRLHFLPNGFDEADFEGEVARPRQDETVFLYCGRFAAVAGRDPDLLLRALRGVACTGARVRLRVVGDNTPGLCARVTKLGLADHVDVRPTVPHDEAIAEIRRADVLVLYQPPSRTAITPIAGKTYEYIRSGRPVLAIVPPGDNADLVRGFAPVHELVTTYRVDDVVRSMERLRARVAAEDRDHPTPPDDTFAALVERKAVSARLVAVFERVLAGHATTRPGGTG